MLFWDKYRTIRWGFYHNVNIKYRRYVSQLNPTLDKIRPTNNCLKCGKPKTKNHRC